MTCEVYCLQLLRGIVDNRPNVRTHAPIEAEVFVPPGIEHEVVTAVLPEEPWLAWPWQFLVDTFRVVDEEDANLVGKPFEFDEGCVALGEVGLFRDSDGWVLRVACVPFEERETWIQRRMDSYNTVCATRDASERATRRNDLNERFPSPTRTENNDLRDAPIQRAHQTCVLWVTEDAPGERDLCAEGYACFFRRPPHLWCRRKYDQCCVSRQFPFESSWKPSHMV